MSNKVTRDDIEANITHQYFFTAYDAACGGAEFGGYVSPELQRLTFCMLVLKNGFVVTGESSCVDIANFDRVKGEKCAKDKAVDKVWALMGYELKSKLNQ